MCSRDVRARAPSRNGKLQRGVLWPFICFKLFKGANLFFSPDRSRRQTNDRRSVRGNWTCLTFNLVFTRNNAVSELRPRRRRNAMKTRPNILRLCSARAYRYENCVLCTYYYYCIYIRKRAFTKIKYYPYKADRNNLILYLPRSPGICFVRGGGHNNNSFKTKGGFIIFNRLSNCSTPARSPTALKRRFI